MVTALQNGEIDFADDIDANLFATLKDKPTSPQMRRSTTAGATSPSTAVRH